MAKPHIFRALLSNPDRPYRLVNDTRSLVLARVEPAFDSSARRTGLLGRQSLPHDTVLAIAPSNAIHTFAMQFPIDVLYIRRDGTVVKRVLALKPRRLSAAWGGFAVLEFGAGHSGVAATQVGDTLRIEEGEIESGARGL